MAFIVDVASIEWFLLESRGRCSLECFKYVLQLAKLVLVSFGPLPCRRHRHLYTVRRPGRNCEHERQEGPFAARTLMMNKSIRDLALFAIKRNLETEDEV